MKYKSSKFIYILIIISNMMYANSTYISGQVEYFYMTRLEDSKLVNIPFRLMDFHIQHQINNNFNISGNLGIEYRNRRDTDFMTDSNLEDFLIDIRELYMSYYFKNGEIRIGKQIHGWGSVDENSPIDNLNGYDYYYLLLGGSEKKLGVYSMAIDYSFNPDRTLSFVYSPMHNTSRIPVNDPDYPIGLPTGSTPTAQTTLLKDKTPYEYGISYKSSFDIGDITISHLGLYDRIFNLSGLTVYTDESFMGNVVEPVPWYSYRYTTATNIGAVFLIKEFTLSFDYSKFETEDQNSIEDLQKQNINPLFTGTVEDDVFGAPNIWLDQTRAFEEKAKYNQLAMQLEMPFENDFTVNSQYFKYEVDSYSSNSLGLNCLDLAGYDGNGDGTSHSHLWNIPNSGYIPGPLPLFTPADCEDIETGLGMKLEDFEPKNLFLPGVGSPYSMITSEAMLINFKKELLDNNLTLDLSLFLDAAHGDGSLISIEAEYDIGNGFEVAFGLTKIQGDSSISNYNFNTMKDFSSVRSRITYYF